jgi:hypothetical protein
MADLAGMTATTWVRSGRPRQRQNQRRRRRREGRGRAGPAGQGSALDLAWEVDAGIERSLKVRGVAGRRRSQGRGGQRDDGGCIAQERVGMPIVDERDAGGEGPGRVCRQRKERGQGGRRVDSRGMVPSSADDITDWGGRAGLWSPEEHEAEGEEVAAPVLLH